MRLFIAKGDFLATIEGDDDDITMSERCRKKMLCANFVRLVRLVCMCKSHANVADRIKY